MSEAARFWSRAPHLSAFAVALAAFAFLQWFVFGPLHLEKRIVQDIASETLPVKDHGIAFQDAAFRDRRLLPVYGSSEFTKGGFDFTGSKFFANAPTGFEVFSIGKAGSKNLLIAERLAALGNDIRGKKVVIILSPTWFFARQEGDGAYRGNFSALQASQLIFGNAISLALKQDFAREMLKFPNTLEDQPLLRLALERLAEPSKSPLIDRLVMDAGATENYFSYVLDRYESVFAVSPDLLRNPGGLRDTLTRAAARHCDWNREFNLAETFVDQKGLARATDTENLKEDERKRKSSFVSALYATVEWRHLNLLLRTLHELGAQPFFLNIPINATTFETVGFTSKDRQYYYDRIRTMAGRFHYPIETFQANESDPSFFADGTGHPSAKGWMYLNQAINRFYHGKLPSKLD